MKRALALLAPAVLTIGLVACGDDDDSPDTTEATTETTEESATDVTGADTTTGGTDGEDASDEGSVSEEQADVMQDVFPSLSGEQIDCLVEEAGDVTQAMDPTQAEAIAEACDIDPADFADVDLSAISIPDLSDISLPGNMDEIMGDAFPDLDDEQIDCILEELGDEFDLSQAADLTDTCDIDPADLTPGG